MVMGSGCQFFQSQKNTRLCRIRFLTNHQLNLLGHNCSYPSKVQNGNRSWLVKKIPWLFSRHQNTTATLNEEALKYPPPKNHERQNAKLWVFSR